MSVRDLRTAPRDTLLYADVAIIGAGPAGLAIARELANTSIKVLLIESGGFEFDSETQSLNWVENVGQPSRNEASERLGRGYTASLAWLNDIPAFELRNRCLGGSTHTWVGKCAAFDEVDFRQRAWLPGSGWPFPRQSLDAALERAADLLNLGPNLYDERLNGLLRSPPRDSGVDHHLLRSFFWQFSHQRTVRGEPMRLVDLARDLKAPNIDILTYGTVSRINVEPSGRRVTSLDVRSLGDNKASIHARTVVLCSGGVENARLLLASNSVMPNGIGNGADVVGRYLADHPRTVIARFKGPDIDRVAEHFGFFGLTHKGRSHFYLHGMSLSPELQERERLTNCATYPVQTFASDDPWAAVKRISKGSSSRLPGDIATVLRSPGLVVGGLYNRLIRKRGLPRKADELRFDVMVEQPPNPDSRVTLSRMSDRFGTPLPKVDWKIGPTERESVKRLAQLMASEFTRVGLPKPALADWIANDGDGEGVFMDMAHPSGTTRMGTDPATSVVDADGMVHGVDGLFIAGSSVFPTGGHANPTLMILALAIRLADHLKARNHKTAAPEHDDAREGGAFSGATS